MNPNSQSGVAFSQDDDESLQFAPGLKSIARRFIQLAKTEEDEFTTVTNARQLLKCLGILFSAAANSNIDPELGLGESAGNFVGRGNNSGGTLS